MAFFSRFRRTVADWVGAFGPRLFEARGRTVTCPGCSGRRPETLEAVE